MGNQESIPGCFDMCSTGEHKGFASARRSDSVRGHSAGIGAVFGVDSTGAVFFNTAVPGSACSDAANRGELKSGDILYSVDGVQVYRSPLNVVASKLLGPHGTVATVHFKRADQDVVLQLERRMTDMQAAQKAINSAKESSGVDRIRVAQQNLAPSSS